MRFWTPCVNCDWFLKGEKAFFTLIFGIRLVHQRKHRLQLASLKTASRIAILCSAYGERLILDGGNDGSITIEPDPTNVPVSDMIGILRRDPCLNRSFRELKALHSFSLPRPDYLSEFPMSPYLDTQIILL